jgi:MoaA/NifB/PqqE/SkfB family radical SAM enzyme
MIDYIHKMDMDCYVYTCGIIFDDNKNYAPISSDILSLIAGKVNKMIFNIEGSNADTYDKIMGTTGCFPLLQQSILTANSLNITTEAHFVPMKLNINEIEPTIELCKKLNISMISFLRLVTHGRAQINETEISLSNEELLQVKSKLESLRNQPNIDVRIGVPLSINNCSHKCEAAKGKININYNGYVYPCEVFKNDKVSCLQSKLQPNSIYEKSLIDIFENSPYLKYVRNFYQEFSFDKSSETCIGQYLMNNKEEQ